MSRQNKVNPGMYTQRGRLTQDDAARELAKQRAIGSEHTWQPMRRDARPQLDSNAEGGDDDAETAEPDEPARKPPARVTAKAKPAAKAKTRPKAKAKAPRAAKKAVLARNAGKGSALPAGGRRKNKTATTAKRKR
jgi:hypothetical protein